ncbi:MAG: hypothetical protein AAGC95_08730 [Pseudomonadota bacterium]
MNSRKLKPTQAKMRAAALDAITLIVILALKDALDLKFISVAPLIESADMVLELGTDDASGAPN